MIHRKAFGEPKPVYGGSGEAGLLAEKAVLEERDAWLAVRKETLKFEHELNQCDATIKGLVVAGFIRQGYV